MSAKIVMITAGLHTKMDYCGHEYTYTYISSFCNAFKAGSNYMLVKYTP